MFLSLMSTHTLRISFFHKSPFKIAKRKIQLSPISKVSGLCSVLITGWVHLGIKGWALFPELRVQGWKFFMITGRAYFTVFLLFHKVLCLDVYRDSSVQRRSRVFVAVGGHDSIWKMLSSVVRWRSNLITHCLFHSHLNPSVYFICFTVNDIPVIQILFV
jgi:hypothetical protein